VVHVTKNKLKVQTSGFGMPAGISVFFFYKGTVA
jgi:hypothetical protein